MSGAADAMQTRSPRACLTAVALLMFAAFAVHAEDGFRSAQIAGVGSTTALEHWYMQSSAKAQQSGAEISGSSFSTHEWFAVSGRATVMAGLLENGKYPDAFYSDNLRAIEI